MEENIINNEEKNEGETALKSDARNSLKHTKEKDKPSLLVWILILVTVFGVVLGTLVVCGVYDNRINGSWMMKDNHVATILTFKEDNKVVLSVGSIDVEGTYTLNGNNVNIEISFYNRNIMSGNYYYEVKTSISEKTLTLKGEDGEVINCELHPKSQLKTENNFVLNSDLLGEWKNEENKMTYYFNKDGIGYLKRENMTMNFTYKPNENNISIKMIDAGEVKSSDMDYKFENGSLIINELSFVKQ